MKWREFRVNYECPSLNFRQATNAPRPKKHGLRFKNLGKDFVFILHNERVRSHTAIQKCHQFEVKTGMTEISFVYLSANSTNKRRITSII